MSLTETQLFNTHERAPSDAPTRQVTRPRLATQPTPPPTRATTLPSSGDVRAAAEALRSEEMGRVRVTAGVLLGMCAAGAAMLPLVGGDPLAKRVVWACLALAGFVLWRLWRIASDDANYSIDRVGEQAVLAAVAELGAIYFFGVFSPACMIGVLALYIFCLGASTRWSLAMYAVLGGGHGLMAVMVLTGGMDDRGLIRPHNVSSVDQWAIQISVQVVYVLAFIAGRAARAKLVGAVEELERAVRKITERDALLNEARRELERAAWVGGEGRFTDQQIGSYRLANVIGRGGMGEVYEAFHVDDGSEAAVKLLQRNVLGDPGTVARFAREVSAAAALCSPHVVRVLEVPADDAPLPYLAMERLRGEDLGAILRREKRLPMRDVLELVRQVGAGLDAAREAGVVHRDLKPQNLFLARTGSGGTAWKILDFGVSKLSGQPTITHDQLVGTPEYMAPEQAQNIDVDHRADLYALAAVIYRCLTTRPPLYGPDLPGLVYKVVHEMPPQPSQLVKMPPDVEAVLAIGLAKNPADRFGSGAELAEALSEAVAHRLNADLRALARAVLTVRPWR